MQHAVQLWDTCSDLIRAQVSEAVWNTTFRHLKVIDLTDGAITVVVPSQVTKDRIEARYLGIVQAAITESSADPLEMALQVHVDEQALLGLESTVVDLTNENPRIDVHLAELPNAPVAPPETISNPLDDASLYTCLLYTSPSPRDKRQSRMPSSA